jgi:hypothetical protein
MTRALYDPQIPPEREIVKDLQDQVAARRGTDGATRGPGEQWILSCRCGTLDVTSDMAAPGQFERDHAACRAA